MARGKTSFELRFGGKIMSFVPCFCYCYGEWVELFIRCVKKDSKKEKAKVLQVLI